MVKKKTLTGSPKRSQRKREMVDEDEEEEGYSGATAEPIYKGDSPVDEGKEKDTLTSSQKRMCRNGETDSKKDEEECYKTDMVELFWKYNF